MLELEGQIKIEEMCFNPILELDPIRFQLILENIKTICTYRPIKMSYDNVL